ncbi:hypothetical protein FACS1894127_6870 [Clostridia bacterium]|nr:hypothetical protein FACS1894127_6870 [Clostridia bacterium]
MAVVSVVKYNGNPDVFAWKYPDEELGTWTQLIVNESQEAILFKGGQACDVFGPGRHTLETANIPILNKIINLPFGGRSPFTAEVWYVNKIHVLDVKWGTPTPIQLQDPKYKVFIPLRSYGQFGFRIAESKKFLTGLVGTLAIFDKDNIAKYFKGLYITKVKDSISSYLVDKGVSVLEINARLDELSEYLKERVIPTFAGYGIEILNFYVNDISMPEDDPAVIKLKEALAKKAEMDIVGYNYTQERSFDALEGAAKNPGSGGAGVMGAGIGMGMGLGIGNTFGGQFGTIAASYNLQEPKRCPKCNSLNDAVSSFCSSCGYAFVTPQASTQSADTPGQGAGGAEQGTGISVNTDVECTNCGHHFSRRAKFCPECGDPYNPCPSCGADLKKGEAKCRFCGTKVPRPCGACGAAVITDDTKFCPECGASQLKKCPHCSVDITGSPKFCPDCGQRLE